MPDPNRFLRAPFAPAEEEITAFDLPGTGTQPTELNGRYPRNGPNPVGPGRPWLPVLRRALVPGPAIDP
jgi:carotenoid cleavage dioxygenase-like enzyme